MGKETVKNFRKALLKANGDSVKMKKEFKNISAYLASSTAKKQAGQSVTDFLNEHPGIKKIHDWSDTVIVSREYELVIY